MKKLCLLLSLTSLFSSLYATSSFNKIQLNALLDKETSQAGGSISFSFLDLKGFAAARNFDFNNPEKIRWSAGTSFFKNYIPTKILTGTLTLSRAASKLNSPVSSLTNPLGTISFLTGTQVSAPSISSSVKENAVFGSADFSKIIPLKLQFFTDKNHRLLFDAQTKIVFTPHTSLTLYGIVSQSILTGSNSLLVKNNIDFESDAFRSCLLESAFLCPCFKLLLRTALHETPYGIYSVWFSGDLMTAAGPVLLQCSYFAIPTAKDSPKAAPLIAADSSVFKTTEQGTLNLQTAFFTASGSTVKTGITVLEAWKIAGTTSVNSLNTLKLSASASLQSSNYSIKGSFSAVNLLLYGIPPNKSSTPEKYYDFSVNLNLKGNSLWTYAAADYKQYPPADEKSFVKQIASLSMTLTPVKIKGLKTGGSYSMTLKNGLSQRKNCGIWLSWKSQGKYFNSSIKVSFDQDF